MIKKILLSTLSILGISTLFWIVLFLNPKLSYANTTQVDFVSVFHNQDLDQQTETIINDAIQRIKNSELFEEGISIQLCLNEDKLYSKLYPLVGQTLAYAVLDKTIIKNCRVNFQENLATTQWAINHYEFRKFNLTWLLAHEFMHNLQYHKNANYVIKTTLGQINWKLEGHAEYISRSFKNDGQLKNKIERFLLESSKTSKGLPVFELDDGTQQILSYFKYALVIQYLMEEKQMNFAQICTLEIGLEELYAEMIAWAEG